MPEYTLLLQVIINGLLIGGIYALIAIGLNLIFGVMGIVNFAHGEFLMLAMYATYFIWLNWKIDPYISLIMVIPLLGLFGFIIYYSLINHVIKGLDEQQIFLTFGLSIALQNLALLLWKADYRTVNVSYTTATFVIGDLRISVPRLLGFIASIILTIIFFIFLKKTDLGRALRATAQNVEAAMLMGVNPTRMYALAFSLGSALVGAAGVFLIVFLYTFPTVGFWFAILAYVIVVLGSLGNLMGSFIGGLIIGVAEATGAYLVAPELKEVVMFIIFLLILYIKPEGIFGRRRL